MTTPEALLPKFEEVVTKDWLDSVIENGAWDPVHGSPLDRWIDDLRDGSLGAKFEMPSHLAANDDAEVLDDPEFRATMVHWLAHRFRYVLSELETTDVTQLGRRMSVDPEWKTAIDRHEATVGVYWGDLPLDSGAFWHDENKPVDVYMEASVSHDDIDWIGTIRARLDYLTGDEEREIRLKEDVKVLVTRLEVDAQPYEEMSGLTVSTGKAWYRPENTSSPSP
ncbi:hypothetical protein [Rhizobium sp. MHM7A]|uniref:hypothetical protein n=1 Tax=Rhizobium sp. MHM7A TaxID=2583233 RepID=UPI00110678DB|nr:hypothetical protein [Rhizobium sp. MHM7A]TLX16148.1 hypothetical protein FFR93_02145 [Rhizobium sp. MHM7A]